MSDLTTQILIDIREELRTSRDEVRKDLRETSAELREEMRGTNKRLDFLVEQQIRNATESVARENRLGSAIEGLNARLDNVFVGGMGKTVREHESRIQRVEQHLGLGPIEK